MQIIPKKLNFKIGADPEFALTMQGRKTDAKQTLEFLLQNKKEFRVIPLNGAAGGFNVKTFGNIGWDNHTATAEIRPNAGKDAQEVVNNLAGIFKQTIQHLNLFELSTISESGPIGGHIHLEIPEDMELTSDRQNSIHRKVSSFYIPILLSENKTNLSLRLKGGYGSINDARFEPRFKRANGSAGYTYEFRCPSAEWLTTPKIAKGTLAFLATIYNEVINHPKKFAKYSDIVYKNQKQGDAIQTLALIEFDLFTKQIINKIKGYIKNFELYPYYKDDIDYILNTKQVIKDKIKADYNIGIGWNFTKKHHVTKKMILSSEKKIKEIANREDFDQIKRIINIHYNEDTNVAIFAEKLKNNVAAFNWKLKNSYFVFGMRKGVDDIISKNLNDEYFSGRKLIKTHYDKQALDQLLSKMINRFYDSGGIQNHIVIDFKSGKPKNTNETSILIGLPYEMRVNKNTKPFLELIWDIENNRITPEIFKEQPSFNNLPEKERGELYTILTKQKESIPNKIKIAENDIARGQDDLNRLNNENNNNDESNDEDNDNDNDNFSDPFESIRSPADFRTNLIHDILHSENRRDNSLPITGNSPENNPL